MKAKLDLESLAGSPILCQQIQKLKDDLKRELQDSRLPRCYRQGTWWQRRPDRFFRMEPHFNPTQSPDVFCELDAFVWLPHCFADVECPSCGAKASRSRPICRKVRDLRKDFLLLGYRYECPQPRSICDLSSFAGWDDRIISKLPLSLRNSFPALTTHKSALSTGVTSLLRPLIYNGHGPGPTSALFRELKTEEYDKERQCYLECRRSRGMLFSPQQPFRDFPNFNDPKTYAGVVPSAHLLTIQYCRLMAELTPVIDTRTSLCSQSQLQGDHSHKVITTIDHRAKRDD